MTLTLGRTLKRASSSLMLVLALVYLAHAAWHSGLAEVAVHPSGATVVLELDPFVFAEGQSGDGVAGCHFFCNHGCPIPPVLDPPRLADVQYGFMMKRLFVSRDLTSFANRGQKIIPAVASAAPARSTRGAHPQPIKAPPRTLVA